MKQARAAITTTVILALLGGCQTVVTGSAANRVTRAAPKSSVTPSALAPAAANSTLVSSQGLRGTVSVDAYYLVSAGIADVRGQSATPVVDALAALRREAGLVANDAASLVGNDAASLVGNDAASLVARDGVTLLGHDGAAVVGAAAQQGRLIANGGGNLIANGGGNLIANGGGNLIANGGGNLRAGVAAFAGTRSEGSYGLRSASRVAPGTVLPAAGMVVQLIDLRSGWPVVMVDSKGRAGDAVLTDALGRYQVYLPESFNHNVVVQVYAPGHSKDARARYARVTAPGTARPDIHDDVSAVAHYCRGALGAKLLTFVSRDPRGALKDRDVSQVNGQVEDLVAKRMTPTLDVLGQAEVYRWSKLDQYLLARRMADRVLAQVEDWENLPLMQPSNANVNDDVTAPFILALLMGQRPPRSESTALRELARVFETLAKLAEDKIKTSNDRFTDNPLFKVVNRYAAEWQGQHFGPVPVEQQPPWLRAGGFDVKVPADLGDFFVRAALMSDKERELDHFLTARSIRVNSESVIASLVGLGVEAKDAQRWVEQRGDDYYARNLAVFEYFRDELKLSGTDLDGDAPTRHFLRLLRSVGDAETPARDKVERLRVAAASIMAVLIVELIKTGPDGDTGALQQGFIDDIRHYATPAGRAELRALGSLKDS
jgi:hypothetical protein